MPNSVALFCIKNSDNFLRRINLHNEKKFYSVVNRNVS